MYAYIRKLEYNPNVGTVVGGVGGGRGGNSVSLSVIGWLREGESSGNM